VGILQEKAGIPKKEKGVQNSGCNLQLASLSSGNATVVDCCAEKNTCGVNCLGLTKIPKKPGAPKYLRQPHRQLP